MKRILFSYLVGLFFLAVSCNDDDPESPISPVGFINGPDIILNPSGVAPLTAIISIETTAEVSVRMTVKGRNGEPSNLVYTTELGNTFEIPILGLYPDFENSIDLQYLDASGAELDNELITITTGPIIEDMPNITINKSATTNAKPGFNFVNYFGHNGNLVPQRPFMFDEFGDIRWYLDFSSDPLLGNLFYDNGMVRMQNGNLIFGDGNSSSLYEVNMFGEIINQWGLQGYGFHHHVIEKPNGNLIVTVNDFSKTTVEDVVIEINRASGEIVNIWDINDVLDNTRRAWPTDLADLNIDWFHANALFYNEFDDSILVSGRTQGTIKLTNENELVWILAPHREWNTSGLGDDLTEKLLRPLDASGAPITDSLVLDGVKNNSDFEWSWYQHSPIVLPNGNVALFDNGDNRNYTGAGPYSRAVVYAIDEENMTIQQVWQYGKERGNETYSRIVSKVNYHADQNNMLFAAGAVDGVGKIVEVNMNTGQEVFEATIVAPIAPFGITFHSVYRMQMYE